MSIIDGKVKALRSDWPRWIIAGFALLIVVGAIMYVSSDTIVHKFNITGSHGKSIIFSSFFGGTTLIALFIGAIVFGMASPASDTTPGAWRVCRNLLATILGALAGWGVAIFYTPFGDADAARLHSLSQAITVFASGYLISKFDRFLEKSLFDDASRPSYAWVPLGLAVCAFAATSIMTFEARQYASDPDSLAVRLTAAPNAQLQVGDAKLAIDKDDRLSVAGKDYGPVPASALIKYVPASQNVYVNGEPIAPVPASPRSGTGAPSSSVAPAERASGTGKPNTPLPPKEVPSSAQGSSQNHIESVR